MRFIKQKHFFTNYDALFARLPILTFKKISQKSKKKSSTTSKQKKTGTKMHSHCFGIIGRHGNVAV
jgi:hypothetical protein